MADNVKVIIQEKNGVELAFPEELNLIPGNVPIDPTGKPFRSTDLEELALEFRQKVIIDPVYRSTTLNGTLNLTVTDNTLQIFSGLLTGFSVVLPDATTLKLGEQYEIVNLSSEPMSIKDGSGTELAVLNSQDIIEVILEDSTLLSGNWIRILTSATASGITSYDLTSQTPFVTTSNTDVIITGFSIIPIPGRYSIIYSSDITIGNNNRQATCSIYRSGIIVPSSSRVRQGVGSNFISNQQTNDVVTVNGSETITVRVRISSGDLTIRGRSLILIRLGS